MKAISRAAFYALGVLMAAIGPAMADQSMVGTWQWTDYTVECKEGGDNGMSCIVTDGPKNKGMEMIRSKLEKKGDVFAGQIAHPATSEIYNTNMTMKNPDTWAMDGCTDQGVCAKGDFVRVK
ncbi:MAG: DUF2147 domain-containing protein [Alphaproteobacteria bacterium]|nr:DUF2147 domain-containing protein [Alphaproteobacteria bacterium]